MHAWEVADQLLLLKRDMETSYFAAQTMQSKVRFSFEELPSDTHVVSHFPPLCPLYLIFPSSPSLLPSLPHLSSFLLPFSLLPPSSSPSSPILLLSLLFLLSYLLPPITLLTLLHSSVTTPFLLLPLSPGVEGLSTKPSPQSVQCSCADHKTGENAVSFPDHN